MKEPSGLSFGLIVMGAFFSLLREWLAKQYVRLYARLAKRTADPRLEPVVQAYLMFLGMIFTVLGLLGFFGVLSF